MKTHKAELPNPLVVIIPKNELFPNNMKIQKWCQQCVIIDTDGSCLKTQVPHMWGAGRTQAVRS